MTTITVRDVDSDTFREFKVAAIRQHLTLGTALTLAMNKFKPDLKKRPLLTDMNMTSWGKGTERISEQVDEILYGGK